MKCDALFHREDFPTLKIGRRLLVTHDALMQWLKEDAAKKAPEYAAEGKV